MKKIGVYLLGFLLLFAGFHAFAQRPVVDRPEEKTGWMLGAQLWTFHDYNFTQALEKTDSCGLRYIEAFPRQVIGGGISEKMVPGMSKSTMNYILNLLKEKKMKLISYGVVRGKTEAEWDSLFAFGKALGLDHLVIEPKKEDIPLISKMCDKYRLKAAIHNHPRGWPPDTLLRVFKGQSSRLGVCADVGHWVRSGWDPVACLKKLEGHVIELHLKDLNSKHYDPAAPVSERPHDVHWGTGVSDIPAIIAELRRQRFKGLIAVEYEYNWRYNTPDVIASVDYFRKIVSTILK